MNDHYLRTATCLFAGLGYSVWRKRGLSTVRYYLRENGYVSQISEDHALRISRAPFHSSCCLTKYRPADEDVK